MHRFSVRIETNHVTVKVWEDAGFICVDGADFHEQPDVMLLSLHNNEGNLADHIVSMKPKVFVVMDCYELPPVLAELYSRPGWCRHDLRLTIGTLLDAPLPEPLWGLGDNCEKSVADTVYRYLLNDVFKETAEWCGHMSSVVRPM